MKLALHTLGIAFFLENFRECWNKSETDIRSKL